MEVFKDYPFNDVQCIMSNDLFYQSLSDEKDPIHPSGMQRNFTDGFAFDVSPSIAFQGVTLPKPILPKSIRVYDSAFQPGADEPAALSEAECISHLSLTPTSSQGRDNLDNNGLPFQDTVNGEFDMSTKVEPRTPTRSRHETSHTTPPNKLSESQVKADGDCDHGKTRLRARNRKAAAKFRVRKKHGVDKLKETEAALSEAHSVLTSQVSSLRQETLMLRTMVLEHSGCGCEHIDDFIQQSANRMVRRQSLVGAASRIPSSPVLISEDKE